MVLLPWIKTKYKSDDEFGRDHRVEPKGNAKTLRQKDRIWTILCRVGMTHAEGATGFRESLR
jgi:hypothetical protein